MRSPDFDRSRHLADPHDREVEFQRLCRQQGLDPEQLRAAWAAGEVDPDAGYEPDSPYHGKDIATLAMLLPATHVRPARRA
jgi:hypothetical protein